MTFILALMPGLLPSLNSAPEDTHNVHRGSSTATKALNLDHHLSTNFMIKVKHYFICHGARVEFKYRHLSARLVVCLQPQHSVGGGGVRQEDCETKTKLGRVIHCQERKE